MKPSNRTNVLRVIDELDEFYYIVNFYCGWKIRDPSFKVSTSAEKRIKMRSYCDHTCAPVTHNYSRG